MIGMRDSIGTANIRRAPQVEQLWYLLVLTGLVSVGIGAVVVAHPSRSLETLSVLVGIYLLIASAVLIVRAVTDEQRGPAGILIGIVALIAGVVVIRHPGQSVVLVALVIGIYFLIEGALDLARAIMWPPRGLYLLRGALLIAAGTLIVASPEISVKTLAIVTGIALMVGGAFQIAEGFILRSQQRAG